MRDHLRLHAQLRDTPVWRRLILPRDATFMDLHLALQMSMGWEDYHLHMFRKGSGTLAVGPGYELHDEPTPPVSDEVRLDEHLPRKGSRCEYEYDFGDGWVVDVSVEALVEPPDDGRWLLGGERAGPPEDSGGVPGYERLLALFETGEDPYGEDPDELRAWVGDWEPDRFDAEDIMRSLGSGRPGRVWVGARRALPFYVRDENEEDRARRAYACMWVDTETGLILDASIGATLAESLERAIERHDVTPATALVDDHDERTRLRFAHRELDVRVEGCAELDDAWASLVERLGDAGHDPRFLEPDVSPSWVGGFFEAMAALRRAAPWRSLSEYEFVRVRARELELDGVVSVLGGAGISEGLALYESPEQAARFIETIELGPGLADLAGRTRHLSYGRRADLSPAQRRELKRHRWSHPRGNVPFVIALDADGVVAPVTEDDYRRGILAARAIVALMEEHLDALEAGELGAACSVELPDGSAVGVELTYPVRELERLYDELDAQLGELAYDPEVGPDSELWLAASGDERIDAIYEAHHAPALPHEPGVRMDLHVALHELVEAFVANGQVPDVADALERLRSEGLSRHEAIHALGGVLLEELPRALEGRGAPDLRRVGEAMREMSAASWRSSQGNGPHRPRRKRRAKRKKRRR